MALAFQTARSIDALTGNIVSIALPMKAAC